MWCSVLQGFTFRRRVILRSCRVTQRAALIGDMQLRLVAPHSKAELSSRRSMAAAIKHSFKLRQADTCVCLFVLCLYCLCACCMLITLNCACVVSQVMDPADADKFYFDPLDCTKVRCCLAGCECGSQALLLCVCKLRITNKSVVPDDRRICCWQHTCFASQPSHYSTTIITSTVDVTNGDRMHMSCCRSLDTESHSCGPPTSCQCAQLERWCWTPTLTTSLRSKSRSRSAQPSQCLVCKHIVVWRCCVCVGQQVSSRWRPASF